MAPRPLSGNHFGNQALQTMGLDNLAARDVLTETRLSDLYATPMESVDWRSHQLFVAGGA